MIHRLQKITVVMIVNANFQEKKFSQTYDLEDVYSGICRSTLFVRSRNTGEKFVAKRYPLITTAGRFNMSMIDSVREQLSPRVGLLQTIPGIPRFVERYSEEDSETLVWEYIPGDPLGTDDGPTRQLNMGQLLRLGSDVLEAIKGLDQAGIVHGNCKPSNVILTPDGRFYLIDLDTITPTSKTMVGSLFAAGTPVFWCAERFMNRLTFKSDIWCLALTLICATGGITLNQLATFRNEDGQGWNIASLERAYPELLRLGAWLRRALWVTDPFKSVLEATNAWNEIIKKPRLTAGRSMPVGDFSYRPRLAWGRPLLSCIVDSDGTVHLSPGGRYFLVVKSGVVALCEIGFEFGNLLFRRTPYRLVENRKVANWGGVTDVTWDSSSVSGITEEGGEAWRLGLRDADHPISRDISNNGVLEITLGDRWYNCYQYYQELDFALKLEHSRHHYRGVLVDDAEILCPSFDGESRWGVIFGSRVMSADILTGRVSYFRNNRVKTIAVAPTYFVAASSNSILLWN